MDNAQKIELQKENAAKEALKYVENGMAVGLGTGSTAAYFVKALAEKVKAQGWNIRCVCTSLKTHRLAKSLGLKIAKLSEIYKIDVTVDGADAVDENKHLIKGYGGALTREKVVGYYSDNYIILIDEAKVCKKLDKPIPVEVLPFAHALVIRRLKQLGAKEVKDRKAGDRMFRSDNGFWIVDAYFGQIENPVELEEHLSKIPGTLENGLFTKRIAKVIVGNESGAKEI